MSNNNNDLHQKSPHELETVSHDVSRMKLSSWAFKVPCVQDNVALLKFQLLKNPSIRLKGHWGKFKDFSRTWAIFFNFQGLFKRVDAFSRTTQGPCEPCTLLKLQCKWSLTTHLLASFKCFRLRGHITVITSTVWLELKTKEKKY